MVPQLGTVRLSRRLTNMLAQAADTAISADPWRFQWHPEVWVLVGFLTAAFVYMVKVIGPNAVPPGQQAVSRKNTYAFVAAMALLWVASDWPLHDISEEYLYSAHMLQHMMLSYFLPPLALLATPNGCCVCSSATAERTERCVSFPSRSSQVCCSTWWRWSPTFRSSSMPRSTMGRCTTHCTSLSCCFSLLMWMPVVGPFKEFHMGPLGKCIYLFLLSVVPTLPAAWLTFAEGAVYKPYDIPVRVFGWSVTVDQQLAGAIMKIGGGVFLWTLVIYIFFKRFANGYGDKQDYRRPVEPDDEPLTTADVDREFASSAPPQDVG